MPAEYRELVREPVVLGREARRPRPVNQAMSASRNLYVSSTSFLLNHAGKGITPEALARISKRPANFRMRSRMPRNPDIEDIAAANDSSLFHSRLFGSGGSFDVASRQSSVARMMPLSST